MGLFDGQETKKPQTAEKAESKPQTAETAEPTSAKKTRKQEKKAARKNAFDVICGYAKNNADKIPAEVLEACKTLRPSFFGLGGGGGFQKAEFRAWQTKLMQILGIKTLDEVKVGTSFDEMKVFMTLKAGRKEMRQITKDLIKNPGDKNQIWVSFDANKGIYTVEGVGEQPKNWTGYVPGADEKSE